MPSDNFMDNKKNSEQKMKELVIHMEQLERNYHMLLEEVGTTAEDLKKYASDPENFSKPIWELLEQEKEKMHQELQMQMDNLPDPDKLTKSRFSHKEIRPHWILVR